jgi:phosphoglycolate phosphatase-like HAD superfamily hydrolase
VPKRIAIDIDSTLHHYWDQLRAVLLRRHGVDLPYELQTDWHISELPSDDVFQAVLETHGRETVLAAEPYPGAVETVRGWHEAGHFIHITSHRAADAHDHTAEWLDRVGVPYDDLYCSYDKITRCVELEIDVLVDDSPANMRRAQQAGILPATLRHPWNAKLCEEPGYVCSDDWPGLREALEPHLAR